MAVIRSRKVEAQQVEKERGLFFGLGLPCGRDGGASSKSWLRLIFSSLTDIFFLLSRTQRFSALAYTSDRIRVDVLLHFIGPRNGLAGIVCKWAFIRLEKIFLSSAVTKRGVFENLDCASFPGVGRCGQPSELRRRGGWSPNSSSMIGEQSRTGGSDLLPWRIAGEGAVKKPFVLWVIWDGGVATSSACAQRT